SESHRTRCFEGLRSVDRSCWDHFKSKQFRKALTEHLDVNFNVITVQLHQFAARCRFALAHQLGDQTFGLCKV
ncbi:MAG: hypothetical protein RL770_627, partial [Pseudomonadota bacterium]